MASCTSLARMLRSSGRQKPQTSPTLAIPAWIAAPTGVDTVPRSRFHIRCLALLTLGLLLALGHPASATEVLPLTLEETVQQASGIVVGRVVGLRSHWGDVTQRWMVTDVSFQVEQAVQAAGNARTGAVLGLEYWGGTIGDEQQSIAGMELPQVGGRYLLMLRGDWPASGLSPAVGLYRGVFPVRKDPQSGKDVVVDSEGAPLSEVAGAVARAGDARSASGNNRQPVTLDRVLVWLRSNVTQIKARTRKVRRANWNDPRVLKPRALRPELPALKPGTQRLFFSNFQRPLTAENNGSLLPAVDLARLALPAGLPDAPSAPPLATRGFAVTQGTTVPGPDVPITVNQLPPALFPNLSPEDQYQMSKWNVYADIFKVMTTPTGTFGARNGRFDLCGFLDSPTVQDVYGKPWDTNTLAVCFSFSSRSTGRIIEADIAFNAAFAFTLDDEFVYNGGDGATYPFRGTMLHELGHMWGLQHQFDQLSIMNYCQYPWRAAGFPFGDDTAAIRSQFPGSAQARTDLGVYLYHASGFQSYADAPISATVVPGQYVNVSNFVVENLGTNAAVPAITWSLAPGHDLNGLVPLTTTPYLSLPGGTVMPVAGPVFLPVPINTPPGQYYLLAQVPDDEGAGQGTFPFNNNFSWSRFKLTVLPRVQSLTFNPEELVGGGPSTGTVTLSGPAGPGGITLNLSVDNPALASVPATLNIAEGASSATFVVNTVEVADALSLFITAAGPSGSQGALLTLRPPTPAAPTGLTAAVTSATNIHLHWTDNSYNESHFGIYLAIGSPVNFGLQDTVGANATGYDFTAQTPNQTYHFLVRASNDGGASNPSNLATAVAPGVPAAPTLLTLEVTGGNQITLHWHDNSDNEAKFQVERQTDSSIFVGRGEPGAGTTEFIDAGLVSGALYTYRVRAASLAGASAYSNTVSVRLQNAPTELTATPLSLTNVLLKWKDNSTTESGYRVERKEGSGEYSLLATRPANTTSYRDPLPLPCRSYTYRVRAYDASGNSGPSNEVTFESGCIPEAPTNLIAYATGSTQVTLQWQDHSSNELNFLIERTMGNAAFKQISVTQSNQNQFTDKSTKAGVSYVYRVRATNAVGNSGYSNTYTIATLTAPASLKAVRDGLTATLTWADKNTTETGFDVQRYTDATGWDTIATTAPNAATYAVSGLQGCTQYRYRVRARRATESSDYSNEAGVHTPCPPKAPTNLKLEFTAETTGINAFLNWSDKSADEEGFLIQSRSGAGDWTAAGTVKANSKSFKKPASACQQLQFRVAAYNVGGQSAWSNEVSGAPPCPPAAPGNFTAVRSADGKTITLSWTDNSDNETVFEVHRKIGTGPFKPALFPTTNSTSILDQFLKPELTYTYQIRANNPFAQSAFVGPVSPPVGVPYGLTATPLSTSQVRLNWTDASSDETGFEVQGALDTAPFAPVMSATANATSAVVTGLTAGSVYRFRVRAVKGTGGFSAFTSQVTAITPPGAAGGSASSGSRTLRVALRRRFVALRPVWCTLIENGRRYAASGLSSIMAALSNRIQSHLSGPAGPGSFSSLYFINKPASAAVG